MSSPFDNEFEQPNKASGAEHRVIADRYTVVQELERDHLGRRIQAEDNTTRKPVFLRACPFEDNRLSTQFNAAVDIHHHLGEHTNIVSLLDACSDGYLQYLVYPQLNGETLATWFRYNTQSGVEHLWQQGLEYVSHCLDALGRIHAQGYQHGDINPETVFISSSETGAPTAKLLDAGLYIASDVPLTTSENAMAFRAPEQLMAEEKAALTRATDIYAVGAILYTLFHGAAPQSGLNDAESAATVASAQPFQSTGDEALDKEIQQIIQRAMAFQPEERFTSIRTMADALRSVLTTHTLTNTKQHAPSAAMSAQETPPALDSYTQQKPLGATEGPTESANTAAGASAVATASFEEEMPNEENTRPNKNNYLLLLLLALIPFVLMVLLAVAGIVILQPWQYLNQSEDTAGASQEMPAGVISGEEEDGFTDDVQEEQAYDDENYDEMEFDALPPEEQDALTPPTPVEADMTASYADTEESSEEEAPPVPVESPQEDSASASETGVELTPISPPLDIVEPEPASPEPQETAPQQAAHQEPSPPTQEPQQTEVQRRTPERQVLPEDQLPEARPPEPVESNPQRNFGWDDDPEDDEDDWEVLLEETRKIE